MFATNQQLWRPWGGLQMPVMVMGSGGLFFLSVQIGDAVNHQSARAECRTCSSLVYTLGRMLGSFVGHDLSQVHHNSPLCPGPHLFCNGHRRECSPAAPPDELSVGPYFCLHTFGWGLQTDPIAMQASTEVRKDDSDPAECVAGPW